MLICSAPSFLLIPSDSSRVISEIIWIRMWIYFYHRLQQKPASLFGTKRDPALPAFHSLNAALQSPINV